MSKLDKNTIAIIRQACEAATPAPWRATGPSSVVGCAVFAQPDPTKNTFNVAVGISPADAAFAIVARTWLPKLLDEVEALEERRQYGADIINELTLEAELADAHTKEVEAQLVELMKAVSTLRRMATGSTPQCVNLAAIDRVLAGIPIHSGTACTAAPAGWRCTRGAGHEGPCAAVPVVTQEGGEHV